MTSLILSPGFHCNMYVTSPASPAKKLLFVSPFFICFQVQIKKKKKETKFLAASPKTLVNVLSSSKNRLNVLVKMVRYVFPRTPYRSLEFWRLISEWRKRA